MAVIVNYERDVKPFDDDINDFSDEDIASFIAGQTIGPISLGQSREFHFRAGWWYQAENGVYEGEWQSIKDDPDSPPEIKDMLRRIWQVIFGVGQSTMGTELLRDVFGAVAVNQLSDDWRGFFEYAIAEGHTTQQEAVQFYLLGRGYKYPIAPVADDVSEARINWMASSEQGAAMTNVNNRANTAVAAGQTALDNNEVPSAIEAAANTAWINWTP